MKQLLIISGKGGTGKTTVASAFVDLAGRCAFGDCDVAAPNMHLIFTEGKPVLNQEFIGFQKAVIDQALCTHCGVCEQHCRFGAVKKGVVNAYLCEGCGVCELVCPVSLNGVKAVKMVDQPGGSCTVTETPYGLFSTAELKSGSGGSGKLVSSVKQNLTDRLQEEQLVIWDGAPGAGCPIISSVAGVDMVLLVAEPSISAISDMERVLCAVDQFETSCAVCINKADTCPECTEQIQLFCEEQEIPFVGEIPNDPLVLKAINHSRAVTEYEDSPAGEAIRAIYQKVMEILLQGTGLVQV